MPEGTEGRARTLRGPRPRPRPRPAHVAAVGGAQGAWPRWPRPGVGPAPLLGAGRLLLGLGLRLPPPRGRALGSRIRRAAASGAGAKSGRRRHGPSALCPRLALKRGSPGRCGPVPSRVAVALSGPDEPPTQPGPAGPRAPQRGHHRGPEALPRPHCPRGLAAPSTCRAPRRKLSPGTQPNPVMQIQEDGDNLIPFAKCSRVVSRSPPPGLASQNLIPTPQCYGDVFWENLCQRPSPTWSEEYIPPMLRATGCSQPGLYPLDGLPPPEMLCRRKRRKPHLEGMKQGSGGVPARVRAVSYHLEDLRRRQRIINEMKKALWGNVGAASEPPVLHEEGCGFSSTTEYTDLEEQGAIYPQEEDHSVPPGRAQLLWSPWSPLGQEGACASSRRPSSGTYSTVTVRRNPVYNPWGVELESEE